MRRCEGLTFTGPPPLWPQSLREPRHGCRSRTLARGPGYSKVATAAQPTLVMKYPILQASQTLDGTKVDVPNWVNC
jgi:hypothetical protein